MSGVLITTRYCVILILNSNTGRPQTHSLGHMGPNPTDRVCLDWSLYGSASAKRCI